MRRRDLLKGSVSYAVLAKGGVPVLLGGHLLDTDSIISSGTTSSGGGGATSWPDGFNALGLYYPQIVQTSTQNGSTGLIGSGFARGLAGPQTWSLSGTIASHASIQNTSLKYTGGAYFPAGAYPGTISVTDGTTTLSQAITLVNQANAIELSSNVVMDTATPYGYEPTNTSPIGVIGTFGATGAATVAVGGSFFEIDNYAQYLDTSPGANPLTSHYGQYPITMGMPVSGGTIANSTTAWIITEVPPALRFTQENTLYTNTPQSTTFGSILAFSDAEIGGYTMTDTQNALVIGSTGNVETLNTLALGAGTIDVMVSSVTGRTSALAIPYVVQQGTNLPASDITIVFESGLTNVMGSAASPGPINVGSVTVAGIAAPEWQIAIQNSEAQMLTSYFGGLQPKYTITPRAGTATIADIAANYLSAEADVLIFSATQGPTLCTAPGTLTVGAATGSNLIVLPTGTINAGGTYSSWNSAVDAFWSAPSTYAGGTITLPGGTYLPAKCVFVGSITGSTLAVSLVLSGGIALGQLIEDVEIASFVSGTLGNVGTYTLAGSPGNISGTLTSDDFSRLQLGHGSNQQYYPGPITVQGTSATNPAILRINGAPFGVAQGGLTAQGGDVTFANLAIYGVSNLNAGEGNAGAIYKTNQAPYNLKLQDIKIYNSDNGFLGGDLGTTLIFERCVFAFCGIGAGGLTHNVYIDHASSIFVDSCLSFATAQVHIFKSRAARGTIQNSSFVAGENGNPGESSCLDLPQGRVYTVTNCIFMNSPSPNNDGFMLQYGEEAGNAGQYIYPGNAMWATNTLEISNCTFLNVCDPASLTSGVYAISGAVYASAPAVSPVTGQPAQITFTNCRFYNIPTANRYQAANSCVIVDGGGNTNISTWPADVLANDPSTGSLLTIKPGPSFASPVSQPGNQGICVDPLALQIRISLGAAVGTHITYCYAWDAYGVLLTGATWSLAGNDGGYVSIAAATDGSGLSCGEVRVASASIPDSLRWFEVSVTGTDSRSVGQTYTKYLFYIVGNGTVSVT